MPRARDRSANAANCQRAHRNGRADLSEAASEDHERRLLVNIEFVTKQSRIDAEIKRCPNCQKINRGSFPETLPAPLQNGSGIVAFATDLLISRMVPLRRTAQMFKLISRRQIFEATLLK